MSHAKGCQESIPRLKQCARRLTVSGGLSASQSVYQSAAEACACFWTSFLTVHTTTDMSFTTEERGRPNTQEYRVFFSKHITFFLGVCVGMFVLFAFCTLWVLLQKICLTFAVVLRLFFSITEMLLFPRKLWWGIHLPISWHPHLRKWSRGEHVIDFCSVIFSADSSKSPFKIFLEDPISTPACGKYQYCNILPMLFWLDDALESITREFGGTLCCSALPKVTLAELIQEVRISLLHCSPTK